MKICLKKKERNQDQKVRYYNKSNLISPINNLNLKRMKRSKSVFEINDNINKKLQFYSPFNKKKIILIQ